LLFKQSGQGAELGERWVDGGDLIFLPPDTAHGMENWSSEVLTYVSAATPTVDWEAFYDAVPD